MPLSAAELSSDSVREARQRFLDALGPEERRSSFALEAADLAALVAGAYPALAAGVFARPADVLSVARGTRTARDARAYRRIAASLGDPRKDARRVLRRSRQARSCASPRASSCPARRGRDRARALGPRRRVPEVALSRGARVGRGALRDAARPRTASAARSSSSGWASSGGASSTPGATSTCCSSTRPTTAPSWQAARRRR